MIAQLAAKLKESDRLAARVTGALVTKSEARLRRTVAEAAGERYAASNRATGELIGVDLAVHAWPVESQVPFDERSAMGEPDPQKSTRS